MSTGFDPSQVRRVLVIKWSAMGDVVLASALLEDLRRALPQAAIDLNTLRPQERLFAHDARLGRVFAPPLRRTGRPLRAIRRWLRELRAGDYDLVVDLQSNDRSRILLALAAVAGIAPRWRIGRVRRWPYNLAPDGPEPLHAHARLARALEHAGIPARSRLPVLHSAAEHRTRIERLRREHGLGDNRYALFLPGSQAAGYLKRWGVHNYIALGRDLINRGLERIVIVGGPDETEECAAIAEGIGPAAIDLCNRLDLLEIPLIAAGARCIAANDTGVAHVAAAADRPMTVICGPTDPRRVAPLGDKVTTLQAPLHCINCYRKHCAHHACMQLISPMQVAERMLSD